MSKRNFTLLIIVLVIIMVVILGYFYFYQPTGAPVGENGGTNFLSQFNPFGNKKPEPPKNEPPVYTPDTDAGTDIEEVSLKKVSSMPVAGYGIFKKERFKEINPSPALPLSGEGDSQVTPAKGSSGGLKPTPPPTEFVTALRYVARSTGNVYQTFADKIEERRFSSTMIPKVYETYFGNKGESVVMRYLKEDDSTIETFVGSIPKEVLGADSSGGNEIKGIFLPQNIKDMSISPDASKLFYLAPVGDNIIGATYSLLDGKKVQIFDSPFTEWLSWWGSSGLITITTKPSASALGYMYTLDPNTKKLNRVLGEINGLTTLLRPDGKSVLYGSSDLSLRIYDLSTRSSNLFGVRTLPEKCVWNNTNTTIYCAVPKQPSPGSYPDSWYKGEASFNDEIWKIDIATGNTIMLVDPVSIAEGEEIDGIKLDLDEEEKYLFFVNKKDSYLWELELK